MASISGTVGSLAAIYMVFVGGLFVFQRSLLYLPERSRPDPTEHGVAGLAAVTVTTGDGLALTHWYRPPAAPDGPVVVLFHGNAGHIGYRVPKLKFLLAAGVGVYFVEYRGFGGNPGKPSQAGLMTDGQAVMADLAARGIAPEQTILYGESLGCGVAIMLAAEHAIAGLILEAPYTSIAAVAQSHYWYLPVRWLLHDTWDAAARIDEVSAPILVFHGERDRTVPFRLGKRLYELAPEPKELLAIPAAAHTDLFDDPRVSARISEFLRRAMAAPAHEAAAD